MTGFSEGDHEMEGVTVIEARSDKTMHRPGLRKSEGRADGGLQTG